MKKKGKNSPVLTMSGKCDKLHLQFCWKAVLPRNKFKFLLSPKINCPYELALEPFNKLSSARPKVLTKLKLKPGKNIQR